MEDRPYQCPICHSLFRNDSGMKWHIAHRHEIPTAVETISKDYATKIASLQDENILLRKKLEQKERELEQKQIDLLKKNEEMLNDTAQIAKLNQDLKKIAWALVVRDHLIKERLNIQLPDPFKTR